MKSIILLTVLFFTTFLAQAQANNENVSLEIETVQVEMIETIDTENTMEVARLYKNKNNRVIKALKFSTKLNNAKLS
ncbi:hypothetical protein LCGC14_0067750 [marine sediment metagenome]|uniref:Uncharacterized protein n=1 Tax=marine sediment metagenome TaxID=412755 RepID=A0A0F9VMM8_9ZZZZ|nr:hypothetical protein [Maribacter sp.]HDZ05521.1 hypothetical protein [Maribacter sp.]HEA81677.1 hypothetical protein [Maribacter sp.]